MNDTRLRLQLEMIAKAVRASRSKVARVKDCSCKALEEDEEKTIGVGALSGGGKLNPARGLPGGSGIKETEDQVSISKFMVPILKAERQLVTGVVLEPETVDAHGDVIGADVIEDAAHKFLAKFNNGTKLGTQHSIFKGGQYALCESYIAPIEMALGNRTIKQGSWIMTWKVLDSKLWKKIKDGEITGFSIGGKAKVVPLKAPAS